MPSRTLRGRPHRPRQQYELGPRAIAHTALTPTRTVSSRCIGAAFPPLHGRISARVRFRTCAISATPRPKLSNTFPAKVALKTTRSGDELRAASRVRDTPRARMKRQTLDSILMGTARRAQRPRPALLGAGRGRARERPVPDRPRGRCLDGARAIRGRRDPLPAPCRRRHLRGHALDAAADRRQRRPRLGYGRGARVGEALRIHRVRRPAGARLLRASPAALPSAAGARTEQRAARDRHGPAGRDLDLRRRAVGCVPGRRADPRPAETDAGLGCRRRRPVRARLAEQDVRTLGGGRDLRLAASSPPALACLRSPRRRSSLRLSAGWASISSAGGGCTTTSWSSRVRASPACSGSCSIHRSGSASCSSIMRPPSACSWASHS